MTCVWTLHRHSALAPHYCPGERLGMTRFGTLLSPPSSMKHRSMKHCRKKLSSELDRLNQEQVDAVIAASRAEFQQSFLPQTNQPTASSSHLRSSTPPPSPALQASQSQQPLEPSLVFKEQAKNHNTDASNLDA